MGLPKSPYHKAEFEIGIRYGAALVENPFHSFRSPRSILVGGQESVVTNRFDCRRQYEYSQAIDAT